MNLVEKYLGEAIPKVKGGKGRYQFGIKSDPNEWYQKPEMMGHRWAIETLDKLESVLNTYSKSALQKWFIDKVFGTPQKLQREKQSWHYFANNVTKKDIANIQYVLRRLDQAKKQGIYALLTNIDRKSSMAKSRMTWALEVLAYENDYDNYLKGYINTFGFYGMEPEEAKKRFEKYHKGIKQKLESDSVGLAGF